MESRYTAFIVTPGIPGSVNSKDKDGNYKETTEQPGVELILPDGSAFVGKLRETNDKIIEIIGLDADQFHADCHDRPG